MTLTMAASARMTLEAHSHKTYLGSQPTSTRKGSEDDMSWTGCVRPVGRRRFTCRNQERLFFILCSILLITLLASPGYAAARPGSPPTVGCSGRKDPGGPKAAQYLLAKKPRLAETAMAVRWSRSVETFHVLGGVSSQFTWLCKTCDSHKAALC